MQTAPPGTTLTALLTDIINNEPGGLLVLMKGVDASILRQLTYSSARFAVYEQAKILLKGSSIALFSPLLARILAASAGGVVGGIVGSPADLVNVRMQIDSKLPPNQRRNYPTAIHGLIQISTTESPQTLFTGVSANVIRAVLMTAGQIATYDTAKDFLVSSGFADGILVHATASLLGAFVATTVCSPVDVVKSRIMAQRGGEYSG
ncbi:Mitochondrial dicarboxylate transporter, partial [Rhizoclosmatium hyalinum]